MAKLIIGAFVVVAAAVILSDPAVQKGLSQTITALGSGIKTACEALAKAIEDVYKKAKTRAKNNNYANHHIVAKTAAGAKEARGYLAHKNVRIGIDSSLNLVRIKQNLHCHLHTAAYFTAVNNLLKPANGSYSKTVAVLSFIRATLLAVSAQTP